MLGKVQDFPCARYCTSVSLYSLLRVYRLECALAYSVDHHHTTENVSVQLWEKRYLAVESQGISQSHGTTKLLFIRREKPRRLAASALASGNRELSRRQGLHKIIYGMGLSRVKLFREIIGEILNSGPGLFTLWGWCQFSL